MTVWWPVTCGCYYCIIYRPRTLCHCLFFRRAEGDQNFLRRREKNVDRQKHREMVHEHTYTHTRTHARTHAHTRTHTHTNEHTLSDLLLHVSYCPVCGLPLPHLHTLPSLISRTVSVDVKHHVYLLTSIPPSPLLPVPNKPYGFCGR